MTLTLLDALICFTAGFLVRSYMAVAWNSLQDRWEARRRAFHERQSREAAENRHL